jgi:hypothetical protein
MGLTSPAINYRIKEFHSLRPGINHLAEALAAISIESELLLRPWLRSFKDRKKSLGGHLARDHIFLKVRNILHLAIKWASHEFAAY